MLAQGQGKRVYINTQGNRLAILNDKAFLESWSAQFQSQADIVRNLIGDTHWLSDGHHRESILRDFIEVFLPTNVAISSGFVKPPNSRYRCSNEIDILVSDVQSRVHYYNQNGFRIIPPEALVALIEVKSTHSKKKLKEALQNTCSAQLIFQEFANVRTVWSGIAFFDSVARTKPKTIANRVEELINNCLVPQIIEFGVKSLSKNRVISILPTCIFNLSDYVIFFSDSEGSNNITMKYFKLDSLAPAAAIHDMFSAISLRYGNGCANDFLQMIGGGAIAIPEKFELKLELGG